MCHIEDGTGVSTAALTWFIHPSVFTVQHLVQRTMLRISGEKTERKKMAVSLEEKQMITLHVQSKHASGGIDLKEISVQNEKTVVPDLWTDSCPCLHTSPSLPLKGIALNLFLR